MHAGEFHLGAAHIIYQGHSPAHAASPLGIFCIYPLHAAAFDHVDVIMSADLFPLQLHLRAANDDDLSGSVFKTAVTSIVLCVGSIILRFASKAIGSMRDKRIWWDDVMAVCALVGFSTLEFGEKILIEPKDLHAM